MTSHAPDDPEREALLMAIAALAHRAGAAAMTVYRTDFATRSKDDASPVTEADDLAEAVILAGLAEAAPEIPVLAEEAIARDGAPTGAARRFFLVDPIDGTKEFISRNGQFTVNVGLVEDGLPVLGVVYAPALSRLYAGFGRTALVADLSPDAAFDAGAFAPIRTRPAVKDALTAVASRSHADADTAAFLDRLGVRETTAAGSSLKFCLVAEGAADVYPRFGPTMEWDTAAGHAVVLAAGGRVARPDGGPFEYGKSEAGFRNGAFIAWGDPALASRDG